MFKRIQILIFLILLLSFFYFTYSIWEGRVVGALSIILTISTVFIAILIFLENRHPTQTLAWFLVLAAFPVVGFFFYLMFGRNFRKKKMFKQKGELDVQAFERIEGNRQVDLSYMEHMGDHQKLLFSLAQKLGNTPISFHTDTKILTNGNETFTYLFEEIKKATNHIHLEYYIVRDDEIGQDLKRMLIHKANEGVNVRFLYDAVGSWELSQKYLQELLEAGIEIAAFSPVRLPFLSHRINFRNHRKIVVVDGNVGFVGGLNVGDEYLGRNEYYGNWRDTHLMLKGEAVRSLQLIFLQDWFYMTGETLLTAEYLSPQLLSYKDNLGGVQMIPGGPDNEWEVIKNVFFSMIISAKTSIWIASPYFIPDEDILSALKVAALSGIDVRVLVPNRPDKKIVFYASRSYFPELLEAGVKIFEYESGFLHSKIIIVDNELASIGTSNMDMRSFHLNFEVNAFLYRTNSTRTLVNDFLHDLTNSTEIEWDTFKKRSIWKRMVESTSRLLSPLL